MRIPQSGYDDSDECRTEGRIIMDSGVPTQVAPPELSAGPPSVAPAEGPASAGVEPRAGLPPVIFFDGVCGLCNRFIDFVIARDEAAAFLLRRFRGTPPANGFPRPTYATLTRWSCGKSKGSFANRRPRHGF